MSRASVKEYIAAVDAHSAHVKALETSHAELLEALKDAIVGFLPPTKIEEFKALVERAEGES